jgi:hypothetical protein
MRATTIDEVLVQLDEVIAHCIAHGRPHGAFAALYRRVTAAVQAGIAQGRFEDGARMERLDVIFANRYLDAWRERQAGRPTTAAWAAAFEADAAGERRLALQHLLLGINAHINLDLGIAAAETSMGADLDALRGDFNAINDLLLSMLDEVQEAIGRVSPLIGLIDWRLKGRDEAFAGFSLKAARELAWRTAKRMAKADGEAGRQALVEEIDGQVAALADRLANPRRWWFRGLVRLVRWFENADPAEQIRAVMAYQG